MKNLVNAAVVLCRLENFRKLRRQTLSKVIPIVLLALLMIGPISAFACEDADDTKILFGSSARDREREQCLDNGLREGSYFDSKGRIVGSPCDPEEYCSDPSSEDIAVVDYCSDTWNEQGIDRDAIGREKCEAKGKGHVWEDNGCTYHIDCNEQLSWQVMCNDNDIPKLRPTPEPEPVYDCSNGMLPWCVEDGSKDDIDSNDNNDNNDNNEEEEEESIPEESPHNTDVHDGPE